MMNSQQNMTRRRFHQLAAGASASVALSANTLADEPTKQKFKLKYIVGSSMYGYQKLADIVPEVNKTAATAIDIWPKVQGNQREQLSEMGEEKFVELLEKNNVKLGCITQYPLGPFGLQKEMRVAQRLGCRMMVTGGQGPKGLKGKELKAAVAKFVERLKPHLAVAEETGVTIAIENHANNIIDSPDSLRYLNDLRPSKTLGIALAPYHLPQDEALLAKLIEELGNSISMFYAWQHGHGCTTKLPKDEELLQLPGRGELDFTPIVAALKNIQYSGWTEIIMHPVPRGIPILETTAEVTSEIKRARKYINTCLAKV